MINIKKLFLHRVNLKIKLPFAILICLLSQSTAFGQNSWSVGTSFQTTRGKYIFETGTNTYYLYSNLRYYSDRLNFSVSVPLIAQSNDQVTNSGGMFLPTGQMHGDLENSQQSHGGMMGGTSNFSSLNWGLGDVYFWSSYQILTENYNRPALILNTQLKAPTAGVEKNYGTGEYDYGASLTIRKTYTHWMMLFDAGYLVLGDPEGSNYQDPVTYGAGLGKTFYQGQYSFLLYYQGYTKIFNDLAAPGQLSLGITYKPMTSLTLSVIGASGVSETSPDFSLLTGFDLTF